MTGYSYTWRRRRPEDLAAAFYTCARCGKEDQPFGLYSELERSHLDGDRTNDAPENVAVLCRICHRRHDMPQWLEARRTWLEAERERRLDRLDAARPILNYTRWQEFLDSYGLSEVDDAASAAQG